MRKKQLITEVLNDIRKNIDDYEGLLFDLASVGLQKWTKDKLRSFLYNKEKTK